MHQLISTRIFPQTFRKFQQVISRNDYIQEKILNTTRNPFTQIHIANIYEITNLISLQLAELQSEHVQGLLGRYFHVRKTVSDSNWPNGRVEESDISYDEKKQCFTISKVHHLRKSTPVARTIQDLSNFKKLALTQQQLHHQHALQQPNQQHPQTANDYDTIEARIQIRNCEQQKLDAPSIRQTLYFHQLKDLDKHIKYEFLPKTPLFIQDMNRKKLQMKVLDQKNPYGFPLNAPPLIFDIELQNKVFVTVKSTYQETNIIQVGSLNKNKKSFAIAGMKLPRSIQKILFQDVVTKLLSIDEDQILNIHKLAYIGGRVQKLNVLMDAHEVMSIKENEAFLQEKYALL